MSELSKVQITFLREIVSVSESWLLLHRTLPTSTATSICYAANLGMASRILRIWALDLNRITLPEDVDKGQLSYPAMIQTRDEMNQLTYTGKRQRVRHIVIDSAPLIAGGKVNSQLTRWAMFDCVALMLQINMKYKIRTTIIFAISLCFLWVDCAVAKPNVLFIVADDLNCAIGPYGDAIAKTPHLDELASRGLTFQRAYCQQAVCNPSRSSFLTGLRPDTVGVDDLRKYFRDTAIGGSALVTLPQHFKNHGYFCQNIGKLFHNMGDTQDRRSWSIDEVLHKGTHADDTVFSNTPNLGKKRPFKAPVTEAHVVPDTVYRDGQIANLAAAMLRDHPSNGQPFFLAVGFWRPHLPFVAPKKYWELYDPQAIKLPNPAEPPTNVPTIAMHSSREIKGYGLTPKDRPFNEGEVRHYRHGYYAAISFLDAQVGEVLDALDESGHANDTIVVFTSDHGFHIGERMLWGKTSNFELDARVPLIIASPNHSQTHGQSTKAIAELIDLYPTLGELAGIGDDLPNRLEGVSQAAVLNDPTSSVKTFALTQHEQPFYGSVQNREAIGYSLRTDRWRYTEWRSLKDKSVMSRELYDHANDQFETKNIAGEEADSITLLAKKMAALVGGIGRKTDE